MKRYATFAATLLLAACASTARPVLFDIDAAVEGVVASGDFAGVILVGGPDGPLHEAAYGEVVPGGARHSVDSEWRWASVTKMVASLLALQEIERGNLQLDATLGSYLADAPDHVGKVTLRELLTHTSGLFDPEYLEPRPDAERDWAMAYTPKWNICLEPPLAAPGERFEYNACDFIVLADLLETATGQSFPELVETRMTEGLGLSTIRVATDPEDEADIPGIRQGMTVPRDVRLANLSADAAIIGTPSALLALTRAYLSGDIVSDPGLREAFGKGNPNFGYVALGVWGYEAALGSCDVPLKLIERQGDLGGTKVLVLMAPERERSIVAFSNRAETDWGWIWEGRGLTHDLATAAFCED